jgi:(4S)-4-hydroxy-5-phosphonooxypentane-2,3-dione isomerase
MIVTCVHVHVNTSKIEEFKTATIINRNESVKEAGNLRFDLIQNKEDTSRFMIYEAYESEEAAAQHKTTVHYAIWRDTVAGWMAEQRHGIRYNIVSPLDKDEW